MTRWPRVVKTGLPAGIMALLLSACAGGFSSDQSQTSIVTNPSSAQCKVEGAGYSATFQTPARVVLPKQAAPITLTCGASGHRAFVTTLRPMFNEKVFGNLLLGSLAGMIVDFSNGHDTKYPERVHIYMEPTSFATVEARDRWYGHYRNYVSWKWEQAEADVINACQVNSSELECLEQRRTIATNRKTELDTLERRRRNAHIDAHSTAEWPARQIPAQ